MRARLILLAALLCIPPPAIAQPAAPNAPPDLCAGRDGCSQGDIMPAGRDAGRVRLRVARVSVPSPLDADLNPLCSSDLDEYWLLRGTTAPRLIGHVCDGLGISEGIEMTMGDNRISAAFLGGSGTFRASFSTTYRLSPLQLVAAETCYFTTNEHPRWVRTQLDTLTLRGEAVAHADAPLTEAAEGDAFGCLPRGGRQRWVVIPRLEIDTAPMQQLGYGLGDCSAVIGPPGTGYNLSGDDRGGPEVRIIATGDRSILIQVAGPMGDPAPAGTPLARRSRLEVWTADISHMLATPEEDRGAARQVLVDPDTGEVAAGAGAAAPPQVASWHATLPDGRTARLVRLTYPPGDMQHLPLQLTVTYVDAPRGHERRRVATSLLQPGHAVSLGESLNIASFTRCAVVEGTLQITEAGYVAAPFEAHLAAGLRFSGD
jgi:hypothetical protein